MRNTDILEKVLLKMNHTFTSNEFCKCAKDMGYSQSLINKGNVSKFLHENTLRHHNSKRFWTKKLKTHLVTRVYENDNTENIRQAIQLLKENGYKVLKANIKYIEI